MIENNVLMSDWEWDGIVNDPERKEAADKRAAEDAARMEDRQHFLSGFHQKCAERRKVHIENTACRYFTGALAAGVAAYFSGAGGIAWMAWVLGCAAVVLGMIATYGFGKACGMSCR